MDIKLVVGLVGALAAIWTCWNAYQIRRSMAKADRARRVEETLQFAQEINAVARCSDLRTSGVVLENIAIFGSDYLRTKRPLGSHYLRMSAH